MPRSPHHTLRACRWLLWPLVLLAWAVAGPAQEPKPVPRVLLINSYHPGYNWSDGEQAAVLRELAAGRPEVQPIVEYLDWRRFPNPARTVSLLEHFEEKYGRQPFDLVITLDDPAVQFVLDHRDYFGASVPVVFGGVNDVEPDVYRQFPAITGVAQTYDFAGTLALIQRLQPEVKRLVAVHCSTESGLATRRAFEKQLEREKPPFAIEWAEGWTAESLLRQVAQLPDDTAVLLLSIFRDAAGRVLVDDPDFGRSLAATSRVPVYFVAPPMARHNLGDTWETAVWQGMGGSLLSEDRHGQLVARLALRVLAGEPAERLPIIPVTPARIAFDYRQLQRHGIPLDRLPEGAEVFHAPVTFYQVHRAKIIAGIAIIVVLAAAVLLLSWMIVLRRRVERALRRSDAHFRLIARATNDAVWDWDPVAGTMWWNDAYTRQLLLPSGLPPSFVGWEGQLHPDDRGWVVAALRSTLAGRETHRTVEYRVQRRDGAVRHVLDRIVVERQQNGEALRVLGARLDLTERRQAELERVRLAAAVEQSAAVIVLFEADGAVHYANPAFGRATGLVAPRTMTEVSAWFHDVETNAPLAPGRIRETVAREGRWSGRVNGNRADGTGCQLHLAVYPIRDQGGATAAYVLVGQDVTRETKLEEQVRLSQKMEAVGLLAGGIAHDFNNLLQVIGGFAQQARDADTAEDRNDCLHQVDEACKRAGLLARQLLVFSRDDRSAQLVDLDLNELLAGQLKMLRRLLDARIEMVLTPAATATPIRGDRGQLEQVFMNLCINARDAMPNGGRITLETSLVRFDTEYAQAHPWARPGQFVQAAVSDTGTGMDRATLARIFDPFFTTKPKDKGTGLGLAVVYGIVQKHGGLIHVYSEVGAGTTFRIYLPLHTAAETTPTARAATPGPAPRGGTILLAEDDPAVGKLAARVLEKAGYRVVAVADGEAAWARYAAEPEGFDLVVLDAVLPTLSGREVFTRIQERKPQQPVLFCSGYNAGAMQPEIFPGKDVRLLGKPYAPADLVRAVAEVLEAAGR